MSNANAATVSAPQVRTYTSKERNFYLCGLVGQNIIYNIIGSALAYYFQFTLLIPAVAVSTIMAVARVWDAINDPIMGTIVDRTRSKWGKCRPFLIYVPLPLFIVTTLCFVNFGFYEESQTAMNVLIIGWAVFTYLLWEVVYTVGDIPLWGVTSLMTEVEKDRHKLLSLARIFGGIGAGITLLAMQPAALMVGGWIAEPIGIELAGSEENWIALNERQTEMSALFNTELEKYNADPVKYTQETGLDYEALSAEYLTTDPIIAEATRQGERWGFTIAALVFGLVGCGLFQLCGPNIKERVPSSEKQYTLKENIQIMFRNRPFRQILLSGILGSPRMLIQTAAMPLISYYFADKDPIKAILYMVILGGGVFLGQFTAMALAPRMLTKISKKNLYNYSNLAGVVPFMMIYVFYKIDPTGMADWGWVIGLFFMFIIAGASLGLSTVLQTYMITDCIDYEEYTNGVRPDGVFFAGQTFISKIQAGIATIISGIFYAIYDFSDENIDKVNNYIAAGLTPRDIPEFENFMLVLFIIVSIPPAIGCIITVIPTWKYCLDDAEHKKILAELARRRSENEAAIADASAESAADPSDITNG